MICALFFNESVLKNSTAVQDNFFFKSTGQITDVAENEFWNVATQRFFSKLSLKHHAVKSNWFDFVACCRQQDSPLKLLENKIILL